MIEALENTHPFLLLFIRIILGSTMIYYGKTKIKNPKKNFENFTQMGFHPGFLWGSLAILIEFFGGIFIILGIFPAIFASLFAIQMVIGTFWKIFKTDKKFTDYSYDILLFTICLVVIWFGPGILSIIELNI